MYKLQFWVIVDHLRKYVKLHLPDWFAVVLQFFLWIIEFFTISSPRWATVPLIRTYTRMVHLGYTYYFYTGCHQIGNFYIMETAPVLWIHKFQLLTSYTRIFKGKTHLESSNYVSLWLVWGQRVHQCLCVRRCLISKTFMEVWCSSWLLDLETVHCN